MNKYQKAIEEIKIIVEMAEMDRPKGNYPITCESQTLEKIYAITNGDFSEKTDWLPLSDMKEIEKIYWLADGSNHTCQGFLNKKNIVEYILEDDQMDFDKPTMFAEIKPPTING